MDFPLLLLDSERRRINTMNYTDLRRGDKLPSVGVLQKLLNRTGASLVPDGEFGQKTETAVRVFQRAHRLNPDGIRSEEHRLNSSHLGISYAVFCLKKN